LANVSNENGFCRKENPREIDSSLIESSALATITFVEGRRSTILFAVSMPFMPGRR
jgi:hypothetical protein